MTPANNPAAGFRLTADDQYLLLKLMEQERELILDRHRRGLSYATIAAMRSLPLGTVKSRLHRSLDKLLHLRAKAAQEAACQSS